MFKWHLVALIVIAVVINLYVMGKKSVHHEITIPATPEEVWQVLTDFDNIHVWNEVLIPKEGALKVGAKVIYEFHENDSSVSTIPARVKYIKPFELINQTGGLIGILTFNHRYELSSQGNMTKVVIHEDYRGIAVPFWNPESVSDAYGRLARALKERVIEIKKVP